MIAPLPMVSRGRLPEIYIYQALTAREFKWSSKAKGKIPKTFSRAYPENHLSHLVSNKTPESTEVVVRQKAPLSSEESTTPLNLAWPPGVISLSHVAVSA